MWFFCFISFFFSPPAPLCCCHHLHTTNHRKPPQPSSLPPKENPTSEKYQLAILQLPISEIPSETKTDQWKEYHEWTENPAFTTTAHHPYTTPFQPDKSTAFQFQAKPLTTTSVSTLKSTETKGVATHEQVEEKEDDEPHSFSQTKRPLTVGLAPWNVVYITLPEKS